VRHKLGQASGERSPAKGSSNVVLFPFVTDEVRACAEACGLTPEAYINRVIAFANNAVRDDQKRHILMGR
jgi:hypothetical protein